MTLTPPSNIAPTVVTVVGPLAVTGPLTAAELLASEPLAVTGPLTSAELLAAGLATETTATMADVREAVNDVALTAILERDKLET